MNRRRLSYALSVLFGIIAAALLLASWGQGGIAQADSTYQTLPFTQSWASNLIAADDDWAGVPGVLGYNSGTYSATVSPGQDPQTVLAPMINAADLEVKANQTGPAGNTTDVIAEFESHPSTDNNTTVALRPQTNYPAPFLLIHLNTTGLESIQVQYDLRDLDTSGRDAVQAVALHYRVGESGDFVNVPDAFQADVTIAGGTTQTTTVNVTLPAAVDNQAMVQLRILTTNAAVADEWVGVDNLQISGTPTGEEPTPTATATEPGPAPTPDEFIYLPFVARNE